MRIAAVAWVRRRIAGDSEFFGHCYDLVEAAHDRGAQVVVLPALPVVELLCLEPKLPRRKHARYLAQYAKPIEEWLTRIAQSSGMTLVGGSYFKETPEGIVEAAAIADPERGLVLGYKNVPTPRDRAGWGLQPGRGLAKPHDPRLGLTIGYDAEFPESGRALAEEGALVQCVLGLVEAPEAMGRQRTLCQARAFENQEFVVHANSMGGGCPGSSAILSPFPEEPVLAETSPGEEGLAVAVLDFERLEQVREQGEARPWNDRHQGDWVLRRIGTTP